ncbi:MAG: molybdopterin-synthase adenylyltransferase MoeB [Bacteroidota bacterium]
MLTPDEHRRYSRHLTLPEVGIAGQQRLKQASVLVVGAGGLGAPLAVYLAAAGVGRLGLVDADVVELSNLQRQVLYGTEDVGRLKVEAACERLQHLNPHVQVDRHPVRLTRDNALDLVHAYDLVADGTDNFPTRYLVNDASVLTGTPNVYASIHQFEGQAAVFGAANGPCYRCLYPEPPAPGTVPSCAEGGVLGVLPGLLGTLQATEILKLLLGLGTPLVGRILRVDTRTMALRTLALDRDPDCPVCGDAPTINTLIDYEAFCGLQEPTGPTITPEALRARRLQGSPPFVLDVRRPDEAAARSLGADQRIAVEDLPDQLGRLQASPQDEIVVHCRSGVRSAQAQQLLLEAGYRDVKNLEGGLLAWAALTEDPA